MPFYKQINQNTQEGQRILERLLELRRRLNKIPVRRLNENLLLATWNIREFDSPAYGDRIPEAFHYIAEIMARFDIIAVQEVRQNLGALERVLDLLGGNWKYIVTDTTEGSPGNKERMAFVYDSRQVRFGGLAGELVLRPVKRKDETGKTIYEPVTQLARTPFVCGFQAGWSRFMLATVHILYGQNTANDPRRVEEIRHVARFLKQRTEDETAWARNLILLGDFNIFSPEDVTMSALTDNGFIIPEALQKLPAYMEQKKYYDQIAFRVDKDRLDVISAGIFDFYKTVFRIKDEEVYRPDPYMGDAYKYTTAGEPRSNGSKKNYYKTYWRTHQMSDHLPMWVELRIDYSDRYLERKLKAANQQNDVEREKREQRVDFSLP